MVKITVVSTKNYIRPFSGVSGVLITFDDGTAIFEDSRNVRKPVEVVLKNLADIYFEEDFS